MVIFISQVWYNSVASDCEILLIYVKIYFLKAALRAATFPQIIAALRQGLNFSNVDWTEMKHLIGHRPCSTYIIQ